MKVRGTKLLAVLTVAILTLTSGTIQACATLCQPAEKVTQDSCCPGDSDGMQAEECVMDGCDCTFDSRPAHQEDAPAISATKTQTWDVPALAERDPKFSLDDSPVIEQEVVTYRDRGPPIEPEFSGHGLRAPPSHRA